MWPFVTDTKLHYNTVPDQQNGLDYVYNLSLSFIIFHLSIFNLGRRTTVLEIH